jgi:hypothetical protein
MRTLSEQPRFGVMIPQEEGTHIVTVGGLLNSAPERTDATHLAFADNLADGGLGRALRGAEPVTELQTSHFPASRRLRYDRLRRPPGPAEQGSATRSGDTWPPGQWQSTSSRRSPQARI